MYRNILAQVQSIPVRHHISGLAQDCGSSSVLAVELPQSRTKPSIYMVHRIAQRGCMFALVRWNEGCCARSRYQGQTQVIASLILLDVGTCPCPWYLFLAQCYSYMGVPDHINFPGSLTRDGFIHNNGQVMPRITFTGARNKMQLYQSSC